MPIQRILARTLRAQARANPVVTVTGPRQAGKTTLARMVFPRHGYVSLEPLDARSFAREDPRGFLAEYAKGAIIDEIQNVPEILSYLQEAVDEDPRPGRWVLTGSQNLGLLESVAQSLAGRTAILSLLPLSLDEVDRFDRPTRDLVTTMWVGGFPRIHDRGLAPSRWLADYITTYVQRDVRQLLNVGDLEAFTTFVRLCAGRTGTEVNLSSIGADAGVSHNTARAWLSALEAGFVCFRAPAWRRSARKQLIKAPKLHFFDSGLVCTLLGITAAEQLRHHPLRGRIFESWVASEILKARVHRGLAPNLFHFRQVRGTEVDVVVERAKTIAAVEAKSAATYASDFAASLHRFTATAASRPVEPIVVYGGEQGGKRSGVAVVPWRQIQDRNWS